MLTSEERGQSCLSAFNKTNYFSAFTETLCDAKGNVNPNHIRPLKNGSFKG